MGKNDMIIIIGIIIAFVILSKVGSFTGRGLHGDFTIRDDQGNIVGVI